MLRTLLLGYLFIGLACFGATTTSQAELLIDFDELSSFNGGDASGTGEYFDGYGGGASSGNWASQGATFNTNQWGPGWSYSHVNDNSTEGFTNQWAAITGTDVSGSGNYALANGNGAFMNLPDQYRIASLQVTNSTYAALSMLNGDDFAKQFGGLTGDDPDFFRVTFTGYSDLDASGSITGAESFLLADYTFENNDLDYIVDQWTEVNLTGLGAARSIGISFAGSDVGAWGLNTPSYVALDNMRLTAVPEPTALAVLTLATGVLGLRYRRKADPKIVGE